MRSDERTKHCKQFRSEECTCNNSKLQFGSLLSVNRRMGANGCSRRKSTSKNLHLFATILIYIFQALWGFLDSHTGKKLEMSSTCGNSFTSIVMITHRAMKLESVQTVRISPSSLPLSNIRQTGALNNVISVPQCSQQAAL